MGRREDNHLEQDEKVGIALGAGLSYEKAAELLDCAVNTILNHSKCAKTIEIKALTAAATTAQVERRVEASRENWLKELRGFRESHLGLTKRLVKHAEAARVDEDGNETVDPDIILKALKATGDLLDRDVETSRSQKVEHEHSGEIAERHILEIDATALAALQLAVKEVKQLTEGSTPPVIDVEPIE
jgi:hypothetical protein